MKTFVKDGRTYTSIKNLFKWDKNPREITTDEHDQLKQIIERQGQRHPLQVNTGEKWGKEGQLLGGNHRIDVYAELGIEEVWVNLNSPADEKEAIEMAFTDNQHFARYVVESVAELLMPYRGTNLENLKVAVSQPAEIRAILNTFGPSDGGVGLPAPAGVVSDIPGNGNPRQADKAPDLNVEDYNSAYVKQIVLYFVSEDYQKVIERIEEIKTTEQPDSPLFEYYEKVVKKVESITESTGLKNASDVFLFLLKFYEENK